ncbi:hypothetical protein AB0L25_36510 [Spirillospora sp. NPDC052242]
MVRVRRDVRLAALPARLPDEVAGPVLDAVEALAIGGDGLHAGGGVVAAARLVQGRHLAAGSRYAVDLPGVEPKGRRRSARSRAGSTRTCTAGGRPVRRSSARTSMRSARRPSR